MTSDRSGGEQPFNPWNLLAVHIPLVMIAYEGVSWGAKVLYGRLGLFLGPAKPGAFCTPSLERLAAEMAASVDTIGRWLGELIEHRFIERRRRGRGAAEIIFLPHPCLTHNSADLRNQSTSSNPATLRNQSSDSAELRNQEQASTPQSCGNDPATLRFTTPQLCGSPIRNKLTREIIQENDDDDAAPDSAELRSPEGTLPEELAEALALLGLDADAQRRIWEGSRAFAPDLTAHEVVAGVRKKIDDAGGRARPGLLIVAVPKLFEGPGAFHLRMRAQAALQRTSESDRRGSDCRELERILADPATPAEDRALAGELLRSASEAACSFALPNGINALQRTG